MTAFVDLAARLAAEPADAALKDVVQTIAATCARISRVVASGALSGSLGAAGSTNVQDEEQKKLDVITNDMLSDALKGCAAVAGLAVHSLHSTWELHPSTDDDDFVVAILGRAA